MLELARLWAPLYLDSCLKADLTGIGWFLYTEWEMPVSVFTPSVLQPPPR